MADIKRFIPIALLLTITFFHYSKWSISGDNYNIT
nr:MAG TPA: hypothetical protein [Caudoviricetes sp.]